MYSYNSPRTPLVKHSLVCIRVSFVDHHDIRRYDVVCGLRKFDPLVVLRPSGNGTYQSVTFAYVCDMLEGSESALNLSEVKLKRVKLS